MPSQPHVWIVGDLHHSFREALSWLQCSASCASFATVADATAFAMQTGTLIVPTAIVVMQSRPGQIPAQALERLHAVVPLARLVALTGGWCEGEGRTGRPWPGIERVPWHAWQIRLPVVLGLSRPVARVPWLPRTATPTERIERSVGALRQVKFSGRARIHTSSLSTFHAWNDLLGRLGLTGSWIFPGEGPSGDAQITFVDGWESIPDRPMSCDNGGSPALVLALHWPRLEDVIRAKNIGFYEVLAQPLQFSDLVAFLAGLLTVQESRQESVA
jgi:hypothetical protein